MLDILNYPLTVFLYFILVLLRITGFVFTSPFFGDRNLPLQVRLMLSLILTFAIFPLLNPVEVTVKTVPELFYLGIIELLVGMSIGFFINLVFSGILLAGQVAGYQMGLAIANVFDPSTMNRQSVVSGILFWLSLLVFFLSDMHLLLVKSLVESFHYLPLGLEFKLSDKVFDIQTVFANLFLVGAKVGSPIILTLLFIMISLGVITRLIPQMNIFIVGIPIQIIIGFFVLIAMAPIVGRFVLSLLMEHFDLVFAFIRS